MPMDLESLYAPYEDFRMGRQETGRQTTVIRLEPGVSTGSEWSNESAGGQMVLMLEGEMTAEIGDERRVVAKGGTLVIGEGVSFRLINEGKEPATAFAVPASGPGDLPKGISA